MLRASIHAAVIIVVTEIPIVAWLDGTTTSPTHREAGLDDRAPLLAKCPVLSAVAAHGATAARPPKAPATALTTPGAVLSQGSRRTRPTVGADARAIEGHTISLSALLAGVTTSSAASCAW
jgi:hypothetical protein